MDASNVSQAMQPLVLAQKWVTLFENKKLGDYISLMALQFQASTNTIVFFDLWLTVRNPFYDREKRVKYYWAFLIVQSVLAISWLIYIDSINNELFTSRQEVLDSKNNFENAELNFGYFGNSFYAFSIVSILAIFF